MTKPQLLRWDSKLMPSCLELVEMLYRENKSMSTVVKPSAARADPGKFKLRPSYASLVASCSTSFWLTIWKFQATADRMIPVKDNSSFEACDQRVTQMMWLISCVDTAILCFDCICSNTLATSFWKVSSWETYFSSCIVFSFSCTGRGVGAGQIEWNQVIFKNW